MNDFQKKQITNPRNGRRTYLVTYSQADLRKFPTRESWEISSKILHDIIQKTWKMQTTSECLQWEKKSRMDILRGKVSEGCSLGCDKLWLKCAMGVLRNNNLHPFAYAAAIYVIFC